MDIDIIQNSDDIFPRLNPVLEGVSPAEDEALEAVPSHLQALKIVVQITGSREDVELTLALGQVLRCRGYRVRIATDNGLEFFSIGGDLTKLIAFMVKNPGLILGWEAIYDMEK